MSLQLPSTIWVATVPIALRFSFDRLAASFGRSSVPTRSNGYW